jgi:hypothetical protein
MAIEEPFDNQLFDILLYEKVPRTNNKQLSRHNISEHARSHFETFLRFHSDEKALLGRSSSHQNLLVLTPPLPL